MIKYKPEFPSGLLDTRQPLDMNFKQKVGKNLTLKLGTVIEIVEINNESNQSKLVPEYHVMIIEDDNTSIYKNCMAMDTFGGVADFLQFKRRPPKNPKNVRKSGSLKNQEGSMVLVLCLDGKAEQGIIIGSVSHPSKKNVLSQSKEHHLEGEFNGINFSIDKDGALKVQFKSATDSEGNPKDSTSGGSYLSLEKDGSIELNNGNTEKVRIDKTNKTVSVNANKNVTLNSSSADLSLNAGKNINLNSTEELLAQASGNAMIKTAKEMTLEATNAFNIKGSNVKIKGESQAVLDATMIQLKGSLIQLGSGGLPAVTLTTLVMAIGNLGAPTIGTMIGPFSSSVFIAN